MLLLILPALAAPRPAFPKLPPRGGVLTACPTQDVLSRRFSTQNDANGGGYGYYSVSWDQNRVPTIVNPKESAVADYLADQAPGRIPTLEEKVAFLWGLRCAYPTLSYVQAAHETAQAAWLQATGVSPETELVWHSLLADFDRSGREESASCPSGDSWHTEDPAHLARQYLLCGGLSAGPAIGNLLDAYDVSADPVVAAGVVALCPSILPKQGDGRPAASGYWNWRLCSRMAGTFDHEALDAALRSAGTSDWVRLAFEVKAETGAAALTSFAANFSTWAKGWPAPGKLFDATVTQVDEKYIPLLARWRPELDAIDVWVEELRGGPGYAEGCADRWSGKMKEYLAASGAQAKGTALWEALRDPVGVGFLEAYALCRSQTGNANYATMVRERMLPGTARVTRWHRGFADALLANSRGDGTWDKQPLPGEVIPAYLSVVFEPDPARRWLGSVADKMPDTLVSYEETVATVKVAGDKATITFPKRTGTETVPTDCSPDYSHVARIDEWGKFWYDWKCAGSKTVAVNDTYRSVTVPAWEVEKVTVGSKVGIDLAGQGVSYRIGSGSSEPVPADVVWVKKGEDILWAAGFGAP